jgi:Type III restriction enzyme, res subunit/Helicase C-terminal domain
MPIDFGKINNTNKSDTAIHPREIFVALPGKEEGKFEYPRDVQSQVWDYWFSRRNERDLAIKMNTGSGKTIVGLLILKSCLNEGKSPAVYVVPDNYLVQQVNMEAMSLGIEVTEDTNSYQFRTGKAILVINIQKLVNGFSVFGVGDEGTKINIGSIIIDDAHACLDKIEQQFTLEVDIRSPAYKEIYNCFQSSLHGQCKSKALEIENRDPDCYLQVPFWTWREQIDNISRILIQRKNALKDDNNKTKDDKNKKEKDDYKFIWPLIKESLLLSHCVVSSEKIEISPHCIPIDIIPSITNATRKIFMTATLVDDGILSSHFGITKNSIADAIIPNTAGDIGDRMILCPQVINKELTDLQIRKFCKEISQSVNVVVIVPSDKQAKYWRDYSNLTLDKKNINDGIKKLREGHVGLTVLINRYDGVDLPKDACRLLVIDGIPIARRLIDKVETNILMGSSRKTAQIAQIIEQGMGRGVRSSDDYCVVFLMGRTLSSQLYVEGAIDRFSPGTKAQINLSNQVSQQIMGGELSAIKETIHYCLDRNKDWVSASKGTLASLIYDASLPDAISIGQRKAYNAARINNYKLAADELDTLAKSINEVPVRSHLKQLLAEYVNNYDREEAQKILMSAASDNPRVTKPIQGIAYHKIESEMMDQARECRKYLQQTSRDPNTIIIEVNALLESLMFMPETSSIFEESLKRITRYIGFTSQRPEDQFGKGPDVLIELGSLKYLVVECKNGASSEKICKRDCNQLNGSAQWFENTYDSTCRYTPILIHLSNKFEYAASPHNDTRIINEEKLALLRDNISGFIKSLCIENKLDDDEAIMERLVRHNLIANSFCDNYTVQPK